MCLPLLNVICQDNSAYQIYLKELRNYSKNLFACPPQKYAKEQTKFSTAIFYTLAHQTKYLHIKN